MVEFTEKIDWREEFAALEPFLIDRGGVVRVCYQGRACAPIPFVQTVSSAFERRATNGRRTSIRLDRQVYSTRYFADVREEFLRKLGTPTRAGLRRDVPQVLIASGNHSGGAMQIETTVNVGGDIVAMAEGRKAWVSLVKEHAEAYCKSGRLMVVIMAGPSDDQDEFWRHLWRYGLSDLTESGLLLLHMVDTEKPDAKCSEEAPSPDLELHLPTALDVARQTQATEDLVSILCKEIPGLSLESARASAKTLVHSTRFSVETLHDGFAGLLPTLAQDWAD